MLHIIGFIMSGLVIGLIAHCLKPDDEGMSLTKTTLLGMAGAILAGWVGQLLDWYEPGETAGYIASVIGAIFALSTYYGLVGRDPSRPKN